MWETRQCNMCLSHNELYMDNPLWMAWQCWSCQDNYWRDEQTHYDYLILHGLTGTEANARINSAHHTIFFLNGSPERTEDV